MELQVHGTFLITGQTVPLEESVRKHVEERVALVPGHMKAQMAWVRVTLTEVLEPRGGIQQRCRIDVSLGGCPGLTVEAEGPTAREALQKSLSHLTRAMSDRTEGRDEGVYLSGPTPACA